MCRKKAPDGSGAGLPSFCLVVIVVVVVVIAVVIVMIPISLIVPLVSTAVPPSVILIPAAVALGIQVATALRGFTAALAVLANRIIEAGFRFLDPVLAFCVVVIGVHARHGAQRQHRSDGGDSGCRLCYLQAFPQ